MSRSIKIMGILNLTPDSFYAPSRYNMDIFKSYPDILDIGACSTRPGSIPTGEREEWARLEPILRNLPSDHPEISIDTFRSGIAQKAYDTIGPFIVNDVSGASDPKMLEFVRKNNLKYVAMHPGGAADPYSVVSFFENFEKKLEGIDWILDPGFGFNKTNEEGLILLNNLGIFKKFGKDILVGISRKRMTGGSAENTRAANLTALRNGADILRVHDVEDARKTIADYLSTI